MTVAAAKAPFVPGWHQTECLQEAVRAEEEMLEAQSVPVREYLKEQLMPTLTQGLIQCCKARPANPEDYLVTLYLIFLIVKNLVS